MKFSSQTVKVIHVESRTVISIINVDQILNELKFSFDIDRSNRELAGIF